MQVATIPFILPFTARTWAKDVSATAADQQIVNAFYEISAEPKRVYVTKRAGTSTGSDVGTEGIILKHYSSKFSRMGLLETSSLQHGATAVGNIGNVNGPGSKNAHFLPNGLNVSTGLLLIRCPNQGWYLYRDALSTTFPTFPANTTTGVAIVSTVTTAGIYPGQLVSSNAIASVDTRVSSIISLTHFTLDKNATATSTGTVVLKEAVARIDSANFPQSDLASMDFMDGYTFAADPNFIYNSNLNAPYAWTSGDRISADYEGDDIYIMFKWQNYIVATGTNGGTWQYFYLGGTTSGSVLSRATNLTVFGVICLTRPLILYGAGYFIGSNQFGTGSTPGKLGLFRLTGVNTITKISSDIEDGVITAISQLGGATVPNVGTAEVGDKSVLLIYASLSATNNLIAYDPVSNRLTVLNSTIAITSSFSGDFTKDADTHVFNWERGNTWTDSTSSYAATIITGPWDGGTQNYKIIHYVELLADNESSGSAVSASISWSDDDGTSYNTARTVDMSSIDKRLTKCGRTRRRIWRIAHSDATAFRTWGLKVGFTEIVRNA